MALFIVFHKYKNVQLFGSYKDSLSLNISQIPKENFESYAFSKIIVFF